MAASTGKEDSAELRSSVTPPSICRASQQARNSGKSWCHSLESEICSLEAQAGFPGCSLEVELLLGAETSVFALKAINRPDEAMDSKEDNCVT